MAFGKVMAKECPGFIKGMWESKCLWFGNYLTNKLLISIRIIF